MSAFRRWILCGVLAVAVTGAAAGQPQPTGAGTEPPTPPAEPGVPGPPQGRTAPEPAATGNPLGAFIVGVGSIVTFPWTLLQRYRESGELERLKALDREMEREILERRGAMDEPSPLPAASAPEAMRGLILIQDHMAAEGPPSAGTPGPPAPPGDDPQPPSAGHVMQDGLIILQDHMAPDPSPPIVPPSGSDAVAPPARP